MRSKVALFTLVASAAALITASGTARASSPSEHIPYLPDIADETAESTMDAAEVAGVIELDLKDNLSDADIAALGAEYGINIQDNSPGVKNDGNVEFAEVDPSTESSLIERLSQDSRVEAAEPMEMAREFFTPNDPKYQDQWHMTRVNAESAWEYSCGQGVTVAVVDTGIACYDKAPFMKGTDLGGTSCVAGYNFVGDNDLAADDQGHGTHVAGTIAQTTDNGVGVAGLAFCAKLMPVKVLSKNGWGTMADVAEGIRWAADHGAQVINLSLGSSQKAKVVEDAVIYAHKKGVVVVAAAGNSGKSVGYPAAYDDAIAVSATDRNDGIAWFSSRGPQVAIGAPGVSITQQTICKNGRDKCELFGVFNGTSMASPHVAGVAAMIEAQGITDPDAVKATLQSTARPKDDPKLFGAGILDAGRATSRVFMMHLAMRLFAMVALFGYVASRIKKKGGTMQRGLGPTIGALIGSVGLLPILPMLKVPARLGSMRWIAELASRPLGEWDLVFDGNLHKWLLLASALPVMALTALFFGAKRARAFTGGLAIGSAALLAQLAISADALYTFGSFGMRLWAVANIFVCIWLARMSLDKKRS